MYFVAGRASNLIPGMAAFEPAYLRRLVQVTGETDSIHRLGIQLRRVTDERYVSRVGVLLARTVAGFTGSSVPTKLFVRIHPMMWALRKCIPDVLVTNCTSR
jgi:hypothetical protein